MASAGLEITMPTLFIVGGADTDVLELNREAYEQLSCQKELHVVQVRDELEEVADIGADWFDEALQ